MKKLCLFSACLSFAALATAQEHSGTIAYEEVFSMADQLKDVPANVAGFFPNESKFRKILTYNGNATLYTSDADKAGSNDKQFAADGQTQVQVHLMTPENKVYTNLADKKVVSQREFMTHNFLIRSELIADKWKMTGQQKKILGYACMEAISAGEKDTVRAWFTTAIPVASGPEGLGGLPGMILEASIGRNHQVHAVAVQEGPVDEAKIKEPKGGKQMTAKEYEEMVIAKTEEMQQENGGNKVVIKVEQH